MRTECYEQGGCGAILRELLTEIEIVPVDGELRSYPPLDPVFAGRAVALLSRMGVCREKRRANFDSSATIDGNE